MKIKTSVDPNIFGIKYSVNILRMKLRLQLNIFLINHSLLIVSLQYNLMKSAKNS